MNRNKFFSTVRYNIDRFWAWKYRNHILVTLFFILWVGFLSPNTIGTQIKAARELRQLKRTKDYYQKDILHNEALIHQILSDPEFVEKFGRETYLMKRENEDIYLFE
ncbi:MAG: hypothetical protein IAB08_06890 [Bacteroidetes bacterium]|uniref:Septum formation initiator n=1 Tax=Candidatus Pullibacteroides excrementavium TaxID=2840905 RepID=A0A9D9DTN0_9BACT|nr:hypothetical protein [Candidatus Pullibacteroides excrementavium]